MREADRHVQLAQVVVVDLMPFPFPEGRRVAAHVDDDVEDRAERAAHELRLADARLQVHPAQHAERRARVVVLHELDVDPELGVRAAPVALEEEPALVAKDCRLDEDRPLEP